MFPIHIRTAQATDLSALVQLDAQCNPSPWRVAQFQAALNAEHDHIAIAEHTDARVLGFMVWQQILDEMELHLIATAPECRRQGIASQLLHHLFQAAAKAQIGRIILEVRQSNTGAQALYLAHDFRICGQRKNYYGGTETAILMEKIC